MQWPILQQMQLSVPVSYWASTLHFNFTWSCTKELAENHSEERQMNPSIWQVGVSHVKYLWKVRVTLSSCFLMIIKCCMNSKGMKKQILWRYKFSVQVTRLVLVCHTVYQPCLPGSAISWVHSLFQKLLNLQARSFIQCSIDWLNSQGRFDA